MKNVKRILAVSMILAMVFIMVSCGGSESKYAGTWKLDKVSASGMEITPAQMNMKFEFTVSGDGKDTLNLLSRPESALFDYSVTTALGPDAATVTVSAAFLGSPVPAALSLHDAEGGLVASGSLAPVEIGRAV